MVGSPPDFFLKIIYQSGYEDASIRGVAAKMAPGNCDMVCRFTFTDHSASRAICHLVISTEIEVSSPSYVPLTNFFLSLLLPLEA